MGIEGGRSSGMTGLRTHHDVEVMDTAARCRKFGLRARCGSPYSGAPPLLPASSPSMRSARADRRAARSHLSVGWGAGRRGPWWLGGGVAAPVCVWRDVFALHEEGIGVEDRAVAHGGPVEDVGAGTDGGAGADGDVVGLEGPVFQGVACTTLARAEGAVAAHADQGPAPRSSSRRRRPGGRSVRRAVARARL